MAAIVALVAIARGVKKGLASHLLIAVGTALAGGAAFSGQNLYNNFIYKETVRVAFETPLLLLTGAALLAGLGVSFIPGMRAKRGAWVRAVVPAVATIGTLLAAISQLPAVGSSALGALGGVLLAAAGGLFIFDKIAPGENPQEKTATAFGAGLILTGVMLAAACAMNGPDGGADKAALAFAIAEIAFSLFALLAVLAVEGEAKDFAWMKSTAPKSDPGYVPPPPGYVPPPPPSTPRGPSAPRAARPPQKRP